MNIKNIEQKFKKKMKSYKYKWDLDTRILHLVEEMGEFAEIILQYRGIKKPKKKLSDVRTALADIIDDVYAISILNNISLSSLTKEVLKKDE